MLMSYSASGSNMQNALLSFINIVRWNYFYQFSIYMNSV
ncbi:hypothetical protein M083_2039 [Bacteroides fragilis str. 3986 T(B)9]|nr:hypothetical protein M111_4486 [Bacteroides fragilis str. 3986T(B)10]EXY70279.1 hypothetical protein M083_2039 [Bacteroides fragilis str. 3986 T(B)9]EYA51858.1 hypothetical protein M114_2698 [Bacteroides fragilis str. 3986 N(B)22]EYA56360.1 hypothetical protein M112_2900 [Bacteroides fragilis str. 3986 T(B)13]EYE67027.1 hypothetical protein M113_2879 [Bacteroides fragilis str. 3986 N3]